MADDPNPNPNPARITDASWRFMLALLDMEPNTENSGIYANKPGYHNIRNALGASDYSRRHPLDLLGPGDKAAGYDWTHRAAQSGNYVSMVRYGKRLEAAWLARDPRLYGWAEAQGQVDLDSAPEELNFGPDWTRGTPSDSHKWHWHISERRAFVASWDNKAAMLSVLSGETLAGYLARGGKLMGDNMSWQETLTAGKDGGGVSAKAQDWLIGISIAVWNRVLPAITAQSAVLEAIARKVDLEPAELEQLKAAAEAGAKAGVSAGAAQLAAAVAEVLSEELGLTEAEAEAATERAMRKVLGQLDNPPPTKTE